MLAAVGLSMAAEWFDHRLGHSYTAWYLFGGGPEGARAVMSTIASSMMTFTGVVFSVTILVLQLASNQFSPRVMSTFLRDRGSQASLGVFMSTFAFSLLGLRSIRGASDGGDPYVPAFTIWLAVVLAGACLLTFVYYLHHVAQSIRAVNVLARVGDETREKLAELYPEPWGDALPAVASSVPRPEPVAFVPLRGRSGVVVAVDEEALWACVSRSRATLELTARMGDFVPEGGGLFHVRGEVASLDLETVSAAVDVDDERRLDQDALFGVRQLVDIADRALSNGINDPSTAVQVLDQLHDLLRRLALTRFPPAERRDAAGEVRLVIPRPTWEGCVRLALDEIRQSSVGSIQVTRRLRLLLEDVLGVAPLERRAELLRQLSLLDASVDRGFDEAEDRAIARTADPQGHGSR